MARGRQDGRSRGFFADPQTLRLKAKPETVLQTPAFVQADREIQPNGVISSLKIIYKLLVGKADLIRWLGW